MRRTIPLLVAFALVAAGATLAQTAGTSQKEEQKKASENAATVSGTLVSVDSQELILKTEDGNRRFSVDEKTEMPADLTANARVKVTFQKMEDGRLHAKRVSKSS